MGSSLLVLSDSRTGLALGLGLLLALVAHSVDLRPGSGLAPRGLLLTGLAGLVAVTCWFSNPGIAL